MTSRTRSGSALMAPDDRRPAASGWLHSRLECGRDEAVCCADSAPGADGPERTGGAATARGRAHQVMVWRKQMRKHPSSPMAVLAILMLILAACSDGGASPSEATESEPPAASGESQPAEP